MTEQAIPDAILQLCNGAHGMKIKKLNTHSCCLDFYGIDLRFQKRVGGPWEWDEIVGECLLHVEQMADNCYWMGITVIGTDHRLHITIGANRAPVRMTGWTE